MNKSDEELIAIYDAARMSGNNPFALLDTNRRRDILSFGRALIVNQPTLYYLTADRLPTKEDANEKGAVEFAMYGGECWGKAYWQEVATDPARYPMWRPVDRPPAQPPKTLEQEAEERAMRDAFAHSDVAEVDGVDGGKLAIWNAAKAHFTRKEATA